MGSFFDENFFHFDSQVLNYLRYFRSSSEMWHRAQTCSLLLSRNILRFAKRFLFSAPTNFYCCVQLEVHFRDQCPKTALTCEYENLGCKAMAWNCFRT